MSAWNDLVEQLETDVSGIDGTGSYTNKLNSVTSDMELPNVYPACWVDAGTERCTDHSSSHRVHAEVPITLWFYFEPDGSSTVREQILSWVADAKIAMIGSTNFHHGGYADWTRYVETEIVPAIAADVQVVAVDFLCHINYEKDTP